MYLLYFSHYLQGITDVVLFCRLLFRKEILQKPRNTDCLCIVFLFSRVIIEHMRT